MVLERLADRSDMYIYPWYVSEIVNTKNLYDVFGVKLEEAFFTIDNGLGTWYYDMKDADKVGSFFLERILSDRLFFEKVVSQILHYSSELIKFCDSLDNMNMEKVSDENLCDLYRNYVTKLSILRTWGAVPVFLDGISTSFISEYLTKKLHQHLLGLDKKDKLSTYYSILSSSEKKSAIQDEEVSRLNLLLELEELDKTKEIGILKAIRSASSDLSLYPLSQNLILAHLKKYGWLTYSYSGPVMGLEHLKELLNDSISKDRSIAEQIEEIENYYLTLKQKKRQIVEELDLPEDLIYLFSVSAKLMHIKDYRKGIYQQSYVSMDRLLEEIALRLKLSLKEIKFLVFEEVNDALLNKKHEKYQKLARSRIFSCCYHVCEGKIKIYEGSECEKIISEKIKVPNYDSHISTLKGMVAYQGKIKGIAKVVLVNSDVGKVNDGDILVSSATNPDLILAMKRSSAFVTDTGGIISHAAIVAREMKKPCVIGTKIATKVLKDGDLIEVDAEKGIVTILERES